MGYYGIGASMEIKIQGVSEIKNMMSILRDDEVPKTFEITINKTMGQLKTRLQNEIRSVFDRPKPWSVNTLFIDPVKSNLSKYSASIQVKKTKDAGTPATKILGHNITGAGGRSRKAHENWMISKGYMGRTQYIVPGPDAKRDKYGNQTNAEIKNIMAALSGSGFMKGWGVFISRDGKSVFAAKGQQVKTLWYIVDSVAYSKRYEFFGVGMAEANRLLIDNAEWAIQKALDRRK